MPLRRVGFVVFPGMQTLDLVGPFEVFSVASRILGEGRGYAITVFAESMEPVGSWSGLRVLPDAMTTMPPPKLDTLLVAGGRGVRTALEREAFVAWVRRAAVKARRVGSICTGAFMLAAAGLLEGRRATTHWAAADELRKRFPGVRVDASPIFLRDGNVITSAGVTAGIDLALALVEEDHGTDVALDIARQLVVFLRRSGGQSQWSAQLASQFAERRPIADLQFWIADHLTENLSIPALARRVRMSPRHFARVFTDDVGESPARYVERIRVEVARTHVARGARSLDEVARDVGFGSTETLRRAFIRQLGSPPSALRESARAESASRPNLATIRRHGRSRARGASSERSLLSRVP